MHRSLTCDGAPSRPPAQSLLFAASLVGVHPLVGFVHERQQILVPGGTSVQPTLKPMPGGSSTASGAASNDAFSAAALRAASSARAGDQHEELVAAPAEDVVGFADVALQEARHVLQHAVAGLVAERVVDLP